MRFGDLYFIDGGLNTKREKIVEPRVQHFKTDVHGLRNDRSTIENSDYILVGDSFISGQGTSQEDIPANILSDIINKKVATLSWAGNSPKDYEELIKNYLPKIKKNSKYKKKLIAKEIFKNARNDSKDDKDFINKFIDNLGLSLSLIINIIDPDAIVFGGGVSNEIHSLEEVKNITEKKIPLSNRSSL